ncbi:MBL fold metallo-hydrolase [Jannaschia sp. LMIT008]|uniref:MBL fold metallo-hydrolase n=1 Tax=Jannaschia maritima TaxID=3032585 RepID=UPI00281225A8|nr:MBL fold metallo-hydrolase [Jannaschia sp. LMIT008]
MAATSLQPGLLRVVAPNPSAMTADGTATYVLGAGRNRAVIDPGPRDGGHRDAVRAAIGSAHVTAILVTHPHLDHSAGAPALAAATGAPVLAYGRAGDGRSERMAGLDRLGGGEGADLSFRPDRSLSDGAIVAGDGWTLRAVWTPGHMGAHHAFHWLEGRAAFTGDVVMGWASTMISPPDGDVDRFLASIDRIADLELDRLYPGHGEPVLDPKTRCAELRAHRMDRERAIFDYLNHLDRPATIPEIVDVIYVGTPPSLRAAAARNVLAHLIRLTSLGRVAADKMTPDGTFVAVGR